MAYPWPRRIPGVARTVERTLDVLGYERVDVLGVSFGGVLAQQLAHQAPHRVRRLVLAATGPGLGGVPGRSPRVLLSLLTPRCYREPDHLRRIAGRIHGGAARRDPEAVLGLSGPPVRPPSARGYLGQLYAISGWTSLPWLRSLRQPTLVLAGDDDPIVPLANARILTRRIPQARLEIIRGGGHLFILERAADVADMVAEFLDSGERPAHS